MIGIKKCFRVFNFILLFFFTAENFVIAAELVQELNFYELQKNYSKAVVDPLPWAGFWWPYNSGGIGNRSFDFKDLSPADKVDMVLGSSGTIFSWEHYNHGLGLRAADWWGHCNGWAAAAVMEREPIAVQKIDGIKFNIRDQKALLSEYWLESGNDVIGNRVWDANDFSSAAFWDVSPAQFHLAITNLIGRHKRGIIVDRYTGAEVWNQPLVAYEIESVHEIDYIGAHPIYQNIYRVNVTTTMWWVGDQVMPDAVTPNFEWRESIYFQKRKLRYELWLDGPIIFDSGGKMTDSGNIVLTSNGAGGQWMNGTNPAVLVDSHPDFIWMPLSYAPASGEKNPYLNDAWVHAHFSK